ncbi:hypothetical protein P9869_44140 [Streptomyces ossamyceticus]|nr:hypothetical protein [Streptomyces ossamyceticus]
MADRSPVLRIITSAARESLKPLGLAQRGRSRLWIDDHGWWLGVVEFTPPRIELPLIGADGKVGKDANGKPLMVKTRVKISQSGAPQAPVAGPRAGEKRSTSTDAEGRKTETVEVKPSVPPAH